MRNLKMPRDKSGLGNALKNAIERRRRANSALTETSRDSGRSNRESPQNEPLDRATAAEKESPASEMRIIDPATVRLLPTEEELANRALLEAEHQDILCVPRRPSWNTSRMSKEDIYNNEEREFELWKRKISQVKESKNLKMTPFEKSLEVWRQLWRVLEISDLVVQIVDSRNPLLYRCPDLECYTKEIDEKKRNMLLLNKAELLTESQRKLWCQYFDEVGLKVAFFSTLGWQRPAENTDTAQPETALEGQDSIEEKNSAAVLSRKELLQFFKQFVKGGDSKRVVGLVGYPNVRKSKTVNALLSTRRSKKGAAPGKTMNFQTYNLENGMVLCDCPSLIFPNFIASKADMVVNGILSIDHSKDWLQSIALIVQRIPCEILKHQYSLSSLAPRDGKNLTAEEFLDAYGFARGLVTKSGSDHGRSSKCIVKDYVSGKLVFCKAPPRLKQDEFHMFPEVKSKMLAKETTGAGEENIESKRERDFDDEFFARMKERTRCNSE